MKRLWAVVVALWAAACALVALDSSVSAAWAGVVIVGLACVVALAAAGLELLDMRDHRRVVASVDERFSALAARLEKAEAKAVAINLEALVQLQNDVEYLKKKDALGLAGM